MTEARARNKLVEGPYAVWDPESPETFTAMAGDLFLGTDGDLAVVRTRGGCVMHAHPGWVVIVPDGGGGPVFFAADLVEAEED